MAIYFILYIFNFFHLMVSLSVDFLGDHNQLFICRKQPMSLTVLLLYIHLFIYHDLIGLERFKGNTFLNVWS
jgi:succinate dehydrogenase hydrophobic anchor subunit